MKKCPFCGRMNDDDALFCNGCGRDLDSHDIGVCKPITEAMLHYDEIAPIPKYKRIHCPRCGCNDLQATVETSTSVRTTGSSYSGTKGCLGWLLFGPIGLLCGSIGQKQRTYVDTKNTNYWVCSECGNKFRNLDDWKKEIDGKENYQKINLILAAVAGVFSLLFFIGGGEFIGAILLTAAAINGMLALVLRAIINREQLAYEELEKMSTQ